jgi:2-methylcitrate dehydratase PrpD
MQITGSASGRPETPLAAKFDLKYCIALALHGRRLGADDFLEPWSPDPAVLATAAKIEPAADAETGFASARLDVDMLDGATRSSIIATAKGHPANPIGWDDMAAKLDGLARGMLGAGAAALLGHVRGFGSGGSLAGIARVLDGLAAGGTEKPLREIDARS